MLNPLIFDFVYKYGSKITLRTVKCKYNPQLLYENVIIIINFSSINITLKNKKNDFIIKEYNFSNIVDPIEIEIPEYIEKLFFSKHIKSVKNLPNTLFKLQGIGITLYNFSFEKELLCLNELEIYKLHENINTKLFPNLYKLIVIDFYHFDGLKFPKLKNLYIHYGSEIKNANNLISIDSGVSVSLCPAFIFIDEYIPKKLELLRCYDTNLYPALFSSNNKIKILSIKNENYYLDIIRDFKILKINFEVFLETDYLNKNNYYRITIK